MRLKAFCGVRGTDWRGMDGSAARRTVCTKQSAPRLGWPASNNYCRRRKGQQYHGSTMDSTALLTQCTATPPPPAWHSTTQSRGLRHTRWTEGEGECIALQQRSEPREHKHDMSRVRWAECGVQKPAEQGLTLEEGRHIVRNGACRKVLRAEAVNWGARSSFLFQPLLY